MCQWCSEGEGEPARFALVDRPAETLLGFSRDAGSDPAGAMRELLDAAASLSEKQTGFWASPVVALTRPAPGDGATIFAGVSSESLPVADRDGCECVELPATRYVHGWHAGAGAGVIAAYRDMLEWMSAHGHEHAPTLFAQREEYPAGSVVSTHDGVRLMLPLQSRD